MTNTNYIEKFTKKDKSGSIRSYCIYSCISCGDEFTRRADSRSITYACVKCSNIESGKKRTIHGHTNTNSRLYVTYGNMKRRCLNPTKKEIKNYGSGLYLYPEWHDFIPFMKWALSNGYTDKKTIDRKDNTKGYCPDNCRLVDYSTQNANKRITDKNKSGYIGVWKEPDGKWSAQVQWRKKQIYLGRYFDKIDAAKARDKYIVDNDLPHTLNF